MKRYLFAILAAGVWMNVSEFIRNELLIKHLWVNGFKEIGLSFPSNPINGAIWGVWAFIFVSILAWLTTKFDALKSTVISWVMGFVLLWIAMWNMGVMPGELLFWAVPWSLIEVYISGSLIKNHHR